MLLSQINFIIVFIKSQKMVITNLEQKQNRKIWVPIRGGNRGGWSLFNWENVREMPYKDRQMYLGNSATIGVLDKGGKWRKRDWYLKTDKKYHTDNLTSEQQEAIRKDYERMNFALGITEKQDDEKLTEQEMRQLMKKIKIKKEPNEEPSLPDAIGLGFDKTKVEIRAKPSAKLDNPHRLQAIDQFQPEQKQQKKQRKSKKEKKEKKKKDKQRKNRHRDESGEKKEKRQQKHHKRQKSEKDKRRRERSRSEEKRRKRRYSSSQSKSSSD